MTAPVYPAGTVRQRVSDLRTAIRTSFDDPRAWFIFDMTKGGGYGGDAECADWPVVFTPGAEA